MKSSASETIAERPSAGPWSMRSQLRGSSLLLFGKLPTKLINFAVQVLTAQYLSKGDYGAFAYALTIATLTQTLVTFGLDRALTRYVPIYHEQGERGRAVGTLALVLGAISLLSAAAVMGLYFGRDIIAANLDPQILALLLVMIFLAPLQALDETLVGMLAVFGAAKHILVRKHILAPLLKLGVILVVMYGGYSVFGLAYGLVGTTLFGIVIYLGVLLRILREQGFLTGLKLSSIQLPTREVITFTVPLLTTDLLYVAIATLDVVMLEYFYEDPELVANLRVVQPAALTNQIVMSSFGILFTPMAARLFARGDHQAINHYYWQTAIWVAVFSLPIFLLTFSCAVPITVLLYGERYASSGLILAMLSIGYYFNAALGFNGITLKIYRKLKFIVAINLAGALVAFLGNLLLIPLYGAPGAAAATGATLIAHNLLKQAGLRLGTGIDPFEWSHLRIYAVIIGATLFVLVPQILWEIPILISLTLTAAVSLAVLRYSRRVLDLSDTFPEIARIPLARWLLTPPGKS